MRDLCKHQLWPMKPTSTQLPIQHRQKYTQNTSNNSTFDSSHFYILATAWLLPTTIESSSVQLLSAWAWVSTSIPCLAQTLRMRPS